MQFSRMALGAHSTARLLERFSTAARAAPECLHTHTHTHIIIKTLVHGFWPKSENFDFDQKRYHRKGHLKRSRMAQISARSTFQ